LITKNRHEKRTEKRQSEPENEAGHVVENK